MEEEVLVAIDKVCSDGSLEFIGLNLEENCRISFLQVVLLTCNFCFC